MVFRRLDEGPEVLWSDIWWYAAATTKNESAISANLIDKSPAIGCDILRAAKGQQRCRDITMKTQVATQNLLRLEDFGKTVQLQHG